MAVKTLPPRRMNNKHEREHEWITYQEFKTVVAAAAGIGRYGRRDALMIFMAFRHGLRALEVVRLKWEDVDLKNGNLKVRRVKKGKQGTHDLSKKEMRELRKLVPKPEDRIGTVFRTERGGQFTTNGFFKIVQRAGKEADYPKPLHPHMLRHGCGFHMVNKGVNLRVIQDWLGHWNVQNTVIYTELSPDRLRGAFPDED